MKHFHACHGFIGPPTFKEWAFNVTNNRATHVPYTENVATMNVLDHKPILNPQNNAANVKREDKKK